MKQLLNIKCANYNKIHHKSRIFFKKLFYENLENYWNKFYFLNLKLYAYFNLLFGFQFGN